MSTESELKYAKHIELDGEDYTIFDIKKAASDCDFDLEKLPYSLRVLFENVVRNGNGDEKELEPFKKWLKNKTSEKITGLKKGTPVVKVISDLVT